jgi:hypothetical protein
MTNKLNPGKIVQLLTISTQQMDEATLSALADARQNALNRQSVRAPVFTLTSASAHSSVRWTDRLSRRIACRYSVRRNKLLAKCARTAN